MSSVALNLLKLFCYLIMCDKRALIDRSIVRNLGRSRSSRSIFKAFSLIKRFAKIVLIGACHYCHTIYRFS